MESGGLRKLFSEEKILEEIADIESAQELQSKLKYAGLDVTLDFAEKFIKTKNDIGEGKLKDEELESVAGGVRFSSPKVKACVLAFSMLLPMAGDVSQVAAFNFPFIGAKSGVLTAEEKLKAIKCEEKSIDQMLPGFNALVAKLQQAQSPLANVLQQMPKKYNVYSLNMAYVNTLTPDKKRAVNEELATLNETQTRAVLAKYDDNFINLLLLNKDTQELGALLLQAKGAAIMTDNAQQAVMRILQSILPIMATVVGIKFGGDIIDHLRSFYISTKNRVENLHYKLTHKQINITMYKQIVNRIKNRLQEELVGQDEAIDSIIRLLTGYFESVLEAKMLGKKFEGGLILYLTGPPGTGKSTTMNIIQEELKLGSCVCRMSDAVEDRGNNAQSVAARLLKPITLDTGKTKTTIDTNLARQINTGFPTLFCFDEVDKMRVLDSTIQKRNYRNEKGEIVGSSIDEMLRNFGDTGTMNGKDVSGSVVVATSNETRDDLKNLESSLYNRYKNCNVPYKEFNFDDYKEIINRKFVDIQKLYKKQHNIDLSLGESVYEHYCKRFEEEKAGGRGVDILMNDIRYSLAGLKDKHDQLEFKDMSLTAKFEIDSNSIVFER